MPRFHDRADEGAGRNPGGIDKLEDFGALGHRGDDDVQPLDGLARLARRARGQAGGARHRRKALGARR